MKLWVAGLILACAVGAGAKSSYAETVTLAPSGFIGLTSGLTVTFDLPGPGNSFSYSRAGAFEWKVSSDSSGSSGTFGSELNTTIDTYCIQAFQSWSGTTTFSVNNLVGAASGGADAGYIDSVAAREIQGLVTAHWADALTSDVKAAAFQLAIWEIEYDGGSSSPGTDESFPIGSGKNYFSGSYEGIVTAYSTNSNGAAAISTATSWLNSLSTAASITDVTALGDYNNNHTQDQIALVPGGVGTPGTGLPLPMPAALPGGLALLGGLAAIKKLRRRKA